MTEEMYKRIDNIIEDYICNHDIFLGVNSKFFYELYKTKKNINVILEPYQYQKSSATESFKKIQEFYSTFFPDKINEIKEAFDSGKFDIKYRDENLEYDDNYLIERKETVFYEHKNIINIPLYGTTCDIPIIAHEIRHHLNNPKNEDRSSVNDLLTESLSQFEEYLILEYFYNKGEIKESDRNRFYKEVVYKMNELRKEMLFILELIILKQDLGTINRENYKFLFNQNIEIFEENCIQLFTDMMNFEGDNWHFLGHFLDTYMIKEYEKDNKFIDKYKKLNEQLLNNSNIECLNTIELDFYNEEDTINKLSDSMKYIENKVCRRKTK